MPAVADRVKESSTTTGTGTLTLGGAFPGYQTFSAAFGNGVEVYYVIDAGAAWEIGIGTTGAGTLSRDTVLRSSAGGAKLDLAAGDKLVLCAYVADRAVTTSDPATLTNKSISGATNTLSGVPNSATTATPTNTASTIVQRGTSGEFSAGAATLTELNVNGPMRQNNILLTLTSQDYGLITGVVDLSTDYGAIA